MLESASIEFHSQARALLDMAGIDVSASGFECVPLAGGRNNRVFRLNAAGKNFLCKKYFRSPADKRDRQGAEWSFLRYCHANGITCVPKPLARDVGNGLTLLSWADGRKGTATDAATPQTILRIAKFFKALRQAWGQAPDANMSAASDACLDLAAHLGLAQARIKRIHQNLQAQENLPLVSDALKFVEASLLPLLDKYLARARHYLSLSDMDKPLPLALQIPSPSDFGLHNALLDGENICFVDFEYAGRDSPEKLLCDTICQPDNPVPMSAMPLLAQSLAASQEHADLLQRNTDILLPLHRLKWCAIILNEFDRLASKRREFALQTGLEVAQEIQLNKCRKYLETHFTGE